MVPSPQVCVSTLVTVSTMAVVDLYLLEQSMLGVRGGGGSQGHPGVWPCVAVALGDLCFLLALRFVSAGVVSEAGSARRGFASALWFLFLSLLQLKLFFVCQNYRQERRPPDPLARKTLTLLLSVCLPSLFIILTGAEHVTPLRRKQEVRGRLLWVVLDLLDVLDLQAGLWEASTGGAGSSSAPLWAEGLVFFYCYVLLLLLPCVSLTELGTAGGGGGPRAVPPPPTQQQEPAAGPGQRREAVYPWLSLVTINVLTLLLRGAGVLWYRDPRVSTIFLGKNLLALAVKLSAAWERRRRQRQQQRPQASGGAVTRRTAGGAGEADGDAVGCGAEGEDERRLDGVGSPGSLPPSRYHTLSRAHSHARVSVNLDHTEAALGPAYISREL
ncbi:transmembrane protein 121 isoform X2 [Alosa sapidissima]|nr:transmembrane protein 121 isoform X2 [Alosa sapidissima]XP_041930966.1 transmembrane protein 121 isoform X2 [Alosa sapidissima]XP_041930967.1 transmembrane protein 121 isoform X2 [Alosa sapidissima]